MYEALFGNYAGQYDGEVFSRCWWRQANDHGRQEQVKTHE